MLSMRVKMTRLHIDDIATTLTSRSAPRHHLIIIIYTQGLEPPSVVATRM
jgi:hypothetical protein